jgi:CheY-like chemotaxis protein
VVAAPRRRGLAAKCDAGGVPVSGSGAPVAGTHVLPVVDRGRDVGVLVVGRRSWKERLHPEEQSALSVAEHAPDVVLMDLAMPGIGGVEATRRLAAEHPDTAVLVVTMDAAGETVLAALKAGARGYLVKVACSRHRPGGRERRAG